MAKCIDAHVSRLVDMVFSIRGLFGASLDVGKYEEADRERRLLIFGRGCIEDRPRSNLVGSFD